MKQKLRKNKSIILAALAVVAIGLLVWLWHSHKNNNSQISNPSSPQSSSNINYGPPTQTDKQDSQNAKTQDTQSSTIPSDSSGKKQVSIQILSANSTRVSSNIIGVFEDNGTCTATVTKGTETHTFTSLGVSSSNYTQCSTPLSGITGSGWSVVVSYSSASASGQSQSVSIQ